MQEVRAVAPPADDELERFYAQRRELFTQRAAHRRGRVEGQQQEIAGDHWRQHQRQVHKPVQHLLARKLPAGQRMGHEKTQGQRGQGRPGRDFQRQGQGLPFLRAEPSGH